ncbi:acyltransferase family protein [Montanilutibacter psychrotolerans]|uniref:Acyltransferase n=1 Tax=Montanilutibacter psychrotolerans TaxID=1327343 RepID=A0A3M8T370_9GAMM|nr:acyltransferase [Lysobacter psychrotolerans]RNF85212.1 acyltransferase [Lysobacter psychrotolerans]
MSRLSGLDLLRAIAIVWVMLFHSFIAGGLGDSYSWLSRYGWMGVDLFFVLSGYLIGSQLLKPLSQGESPSLRDFYVRRAFRVLPAFLAVLAVYFTVPAFREADGIQPLWQFLTFTVNFLIDYEHNKAFSHVWSLCVEEHFYLVFPWLALWLARRPSAKRFVCVCVALVLAGIAIRGYVWIFEMLPVRDLEDVERSFGRRFVEDIYYPTYARLDGLLAGVVLAAVRFYRPSAWARLQAKANWLLLGGVVGVALAMWLFRDRVGLIGNTFGFPVLSAGLALLVASAAGREGWIARCRVPGAGWIAVASYSLYLTHKQVFHFVSETFGAQLEGRGLLAFAAYAVATLLAGALLHYAVERPFLQLRDRWARRRPAASTGGEGGSMPSAEVASASQPTA